MYKTDATFNINSLKLLLSVLVGINNYKKTFPIAFYYITFKAVVSFRFITDELTDLAFYNYLKLDVIVRDFFKGLRAACAVKAAFNLSLTKIIKEVLVCLLEEDKEMLNAV